MRCLFTPADWYDLPLFHSGSSLHPGVDMPVVKLPVEIQEDWIIIDVGSNLLSLGPR